MSQRVALVTGASRGIGAAIAAGLAAHGIKVVVGYLSNPALAESVAAQIRANGGEAITERIDVSDRASIRAAIDSVSCSFGPVDILVNNAAIAQEKPFLTITDEDWDQMLGANLRGPFACTQEVLPGMIERGWGRVVNIVSIGGQWGGVNQIHYASAKAGLIGLTRSLAKTFSAKGVTVNAVSPGLIETDMIRNELATPEGQKKAAAIPAGRVGHVDEVAKTVAFLVLPGSDYVTGQTINVNGGMYFG
jgi:NAD(P)-dependent dehydrogenase (short-subunit alcohol dehydrogenase family)